MARQFTPKVVTANRLREGDVVYLTADDRWSALHTEAELIEDEDGRPLRATAFDAASLYDPQSERYVGWRKMDVTTAPGYMTPAEVNRLALDRLQELGTRPEHVTVVTPLLPEVRIGQVMRIHGGETVGVAGELYRVQAVRHEVRRRPHEVAVTTLEGRWLG